MKNFKIIILVIILRCLILGVIILQTFILWREEHSNLFFLFFALTVCVSVSLYLKTSLTHPGEVAVCPSRYVKVLLDHHIIDQSVETRQTINFPVADPYRGSSVVSAAQHNTVSNLSSGVPSSVLPTNNHETGVKATRLHGRTLRKKKLRNRTKYIRINDEGDSSWSFTSDDTSLNIEGALFEQRNTLTPRRQPGPSCKVDTCCEELPYSHISQFLPLQESPYKNSSKTRDTAVDVCPSEVQHRDISFPQATFQRSPSVSLKNSLSITDPLAKRTMAPTAATFGKALSVVVGTTAKPALFVTDVASQIQSKIRHYNPRPFDLPFFNVQKKNDSMQTTLSPSLQEALRYIKVLRCTKDGVPTQNNIELRFCSICGKYQPLRAKHCEECGICIRTMDHHCPWLGTCVGEGNHFFFYWYLWFQAIELALTLFQIVRLLVFYPEPLDEETALLVYRMLMFFFFVILCSLLVMVIGLLGYHTFLVLVFTHFTLMTSNFQLFFAYSDNVIHTPSCPKCFYCVGGHKDKCVPTLSKGAYSRSSLHFKTNTTTWENIAWRRVTYLKDLSELDGGPFSHGAKSNLRVFCCPLMLQNIFKIEIDVTYGERGEIIWEYGSQHPSPCAIFCHSCCVED